MRGDILFDVARELEVMPCEAGPHSFLSLNSSATATWKYVSTGAYRLIGNVEIDMNAQ